MMFGTMKPIFGLSVVGRANSSFKPQTMIVSPCLTILEPSADETDPTEIDTGLVEVRP